MHSRQLIARIGFWVLTLVPLSACTYLIPPDDSAPRYNEVVDTPRHRPELNDASERPAHRQDDDEPQSSLTPSAPAPTMQAAGADAVTASNIAPPVAVSPAPLPAPVASGRQVPSENVTVLAENGAPPISNVPPKPDAKETQATKDSLSDTQRELKEDNAHAMASKRQLDKDAAAEPTLSALPEEAPVTSAPLAPPPGAAPAPAVQPPVGAPQSNAAPGPAPIASALPPAPPMLPSNGLPLLPPPPPLPAYPIADASPLVPTPPSAGLTPLPPRPPEAIGTIPPAPVAPAVVASAAQPMAFPPPPVQMAPLPAASIRLTPPSTPAIARRATPTDNSSAQVANTAMPQPMSGGFDPMATASSTPASSPTTIYASSGFLPQSRYAAKR